MNDGLSPIARSFQADDGQTHPGPLPRPIVEQAGKRPGPVDVSAFRTDLATVSEPIAVQTNRQLTVTPLDGATFVVVRPAIGSQGDQRSINGPAFTPEPGSVFPDIRPFTLGYPDDDSA